jgi:hypothetical protein
MQKKILSEAQYERVRRVWVQTLTDPQLGLNYLEQWKLFEEFLGRNGGGFKPNAELHRRKIAFDKRAWLVFRLKHGV